MEEPLATGKGEATTLTGKPADVEPSFAAKLSAIPVGLVFGYCLQAGDVYAPAVISAQFVGQNWLMMKMFLAAMATSCAVLAVLDARSDGHPHLLKMREVARCATKGLPAAILGGMLLGAGMAICGACPGTIYVQLGSAVGSSPFVLLGAMLAAFSFVLLHHRFFKGFHSSNMIHPSFETVDGVLGVSYSTAASLLAAVAIGVIILLHFVQPQPLLPHGIATWPGWLAGAGIGLLQLPAVVVMPAMLGSSSSFVMLASRVLALFVDTEQEQWSYLRKYASSKPRLVWQAILVVCMVLGGALSANLNGSFATVPGSSPLRAIVGGFLILFGARIAGGCTSGHGLSGVAQLRVTSLAAVAGMFAGGFAVGFSMQAAGVKVVL